MKLNKNKITVETNQNGEISSIAYDGTEILHDGKQWWDKTYPVIWPVIGFSDSFVVDGKSYQLPKHGFWKELDWKEMLENESITQVATHLKDEKYPYSIDIENNISIQNNDVIVKTTFTNLGKEIAYFHFGHHPAFKIDNDTKLITSNRYQKILLDGKFSKDHVDLEKLTNMKFGVDYDTIVAKDVETINEAIEYQGIRITVSSNDFDGVQVWKPNESMFVCIEPWQGWGDREYQAPKEPKDKFGIISLNSGEQETFKIKITLNKK